MGLLLGRKWRRLDHGQVAKHSHWRTARMQRATLVSIALIVVITCWASTAAAQAIADADSQSTIRLQAAQAAGSVSNAQPAKTRPRVRSGRRTALGIALAATGTAWLVTPLFTEPTPAQEVLEALRDRELLTAGISWFDVDEALPGSPLLGVYEGLPPACYESGAIHDACTASALRGALAATIEYDQMAGSRRLSLHGWQRAAAIGLIGAGVLVSTFGADVPVAVTPTVGGVQVGLRRAVTEPPGAGRGLSLRTYGSGLQLRGGDINNAVAALATGFQWLIRNEASTLPGGGGDVAATRSGVEFGADVILHLTPRLGLVGGVGRITSSSEGAIETPLRDEPFPFVQSTALGVHAVPVRFGVLYTLPIARRLAVGLEGGAGIYFTRLRWSHHLDVSGRVTDWLTEVQGQDLGVHGGLWIDIDLADRIGLVFGIQGTHADISGLAGFREGMYSYRAETRDEGTLSLAEEGLLVVGNAPWATIGALTPGRDASVGLGGFRIATGLRIAFPAAGQ